MNEQNVVLNYMQKVLLRDANGKTNEIIAKFDSGADNCSLDETLAKNLGLDKNQVAEAEIINANGEDIRPVVEISFTLPEKEITIKTFATLADRSDLDSPFLVGRNALQPQEGEEETLKFLIDPKKTASELYRIARYLKEM